jgi:hypothetical protein
MQISVEVNGADTQRTLAAAEAILRVNAGRVIRAVRVDVPYVKYIISGTRPHMIYPVRARALFWPGARHPVASVRHPGTQANDFVGRTVRESIPDVAEAIGRGLARAVSQGNANYLGQSERASVDLVRMRLAANAPVRTGYLRSKIRES